MYCLRHRSCHPRCVVCRRLYCPRAEARSIKTPSAAPEGVRTAARTATRSVEGCARYFAACQRPGRSVQHHSFAVAEAHPLPRLSRTGTIKHSGREFNAPDRDRAKELGTSWPQGSQTRGRCHPFGDRILPEARNKPTLILCRYLARAGLQVHPVAQPDHPDTMASIKPLKSFP